MHIVASSVRLNATHAALERHETRESLRVWRDPPAQPAAARPCPPAPQGANDEEPTIKSVEELELQLVILLVERLTGRKLERIDIDRLRQPKTDPELQAIATRLHAAREAAPPAREGWGMVYDYEESHYEAETVQFSAQARLKTADGRDITVDVQLAMSREFASRTGIHLRAGDALKDPLVINFGGSAAQLGTTHFSFDLDADGHLDRMPTLAGQSAYLALDANNNGRVDDGSELFGPASGQGFAELARHDSDGNGWIDAADAVFERLRLWSPDPEGSGNLVSLAERGMGAIFLGQTATPFALKDGENALQGAVRASGIHVMEDGSTGTVQQIDVKV